ncbi:S-methyl-5-thioribose-1-phosphate isomerase [Roseivirga misakiensis]|uniref:Methylthioribose-1-phosphate isomerase n=1 Tax=Roseivirga misakiensis TaxID=1563681 RepID=A0A1E5SY57_9BACT|nr:S-methyl-5-thioribose-1-phosphate isomerase [Roseivirga misakiensis]OEK04050.1 S-methyl-5-thioribose-1-phosphate isomerase [Roseivirga misakiensis]
MKIEGKHYHTIWLKDNNPEVIEVIDQRLLPHQMEVYEVNSVDEAAKAISDMVVRGAPLIGVTAAYGLYLACLKNPSNDHLIKAANTLKASRPTAVNLAWAVDLMMKELMDFSENERVQKALTMADKIKADDIEVCRNIGVHGLNIIRNLYQKHQRTINILTHCNAGWLATIDWGTATSPIYQAIAEGIPIHVWVDETRPRNQGANLTAYELLQQEVPHTLVVDNTGGHLMQHGMVDMVIVGTDRTTAQGDVANKIGTYLKALAAKDNNIPFYVALPSSTIDWDLNDGLKEIPIEQRSGEEVTSIWGWTGEKMQKVQLSPTGTPAANYGFDVTPARLVTGLITERGICSASSEGLLTLFPEKAPSNG